MNNLIKKQILQNNSNIKNSFLFYFSYLFSVFLFIFSLINFILKNYLEVISFLIFGLIFIANISALKYTKNISLAKSIVIFLIIELFLFLLIRGGIANTGIYWLFIYPIVVFFIKGKKKGIYWAVFFIIFLFILLYLKKIGTIYLAFESINIYMTIAFIVLISLFIYIYQYIIEYTSFTIREKNKEIHLVNQKLSDEVRQRKKIEKKLLQELVESKKINKLTIKRELKIIDLKEKIKNLTKDKN